MRSARGRILLGLSLGLVACGSRAGLSEGRGDEDQDAAPPITRAGSGGARGSGGTPGSGGAPGGGGSGGNAAAPSGGSASGGTSGLGGLGGTSPSGGTAGTPPSGGSAGTVAGGSSGVAGAAGAGGGAAAGAAGVGGAAGAAGAENEPCWAQAYGSSAAEEGGGLLERPNGNLLLTGSQSQASGDWDTLFVEIDTAGSLLSAWSYGADGRDAAGSVSELQGGDLLARGYTDSFGQGGWDGWVLRIAPDGQPLWQIAIGGAGLDVLGAARELTGGDLLISGHTQSHGDEDGWLVRLSDTGDVEWEQIYDTGGYDMMSGLTPIAGGYVIGGYIINPDGMADGWVTRINNAGRVVWSKRVGGAGSDILGAARVLASGNLLFSGATDSFGAGDHDGWLVELDTNGNVVWSQAYGTDAWDAFRSVVLKSDESMLISGSTMSGTRFGEDTLWLRLTPERDVDWSRQLGGPDTRDPAQSLLQGVWTLSSETWGHGLMDILAVRLRSDGTCPGLDLREATIVVTPVTVTASDVPVTVNAVSSVTVETSVGRAPRVLETQSLL